MSYILSTRLIDCFVITARVLNFKNELEQSTVNEAYDSYIIAGLLSDTINAF